MALNNSDFQPCQQPGTLTPSINTGELETFQALGNNCPADLRGVKLPAAIAISESLPGSPTNWGVLKVLANQDLVVGQSKLGEKVVTANTWKTATRN